MDFLGELIALGIDAVIVGVCTRLYLNCSWSINLIERAQRLGVNPDIKKLSDEEKKYTIYQGDVKAVGKSVKSSSSQDYSGVILRRSIMEHAIARNASGFWADQKNIIHVSHNVVPFILKKGKVSIEILDPVSAELLDLDTVYNQFENSTLSVMDHIIGFFNGVRQRGIETTEELLKEGTPLTAVGEVSVSPSGYLQMSPPSAGYPYYLTTMPVSSLIRKLEEQQSTYRWLTLLFGSIGVVLGIVVIKKWWTLKELKIKEEEKKRRLEETRRERRRNARDGRELTDNELCVACRVNPKEIIILHCGHVCLCEDCSEGVKDTCPVCRSPIVSKAAAFI
ncbi:mitochondrial E3 ubiquitin protein ligase 1 [Halyomorpha halys]|uniref:mitochondrial E3 ubiquitin protein ligase 1 n=1 Tax=Halyomorpha halys TaxID=286706 RepID=UPI0006D50448|nr:mitochondrial E3 ubiquitin protein ligase 1 [Halyomorpha halys]XP_014280755.1 mitochondrial E3 ubiquitin protein ligase 1 [Halyomorpha halys]XP_014280757.1 mitochondrial E3 ubiquitin protein ligase 1 [Halyomorpha halys]